MWVFIFRALNVPNGQLQSPKAASCAGRQRARPERRQTRATRAMTIQAGGNRTLIGDAPEASVGRQAAFAGYRQRRRVVPRRAVKCRGSTIGANAPLTASSLDFEHFPEELQKLGDIRCGKDS